MAAGNEEDEVELLQVDLGDMVKLKQVLDETVSSAIVEMTDIPEDYRWDNVKLGIMALACVFAMIAQFAPIPFPESRPVLGICGSLYFMLSGILQFITTFIDKDCILLTKPSIVSNNKEFHKYGLRVRSTLPRFSEYYTVTLEFQGYNNNNNNNNLKTASSPCCSQKWSVGQFFDGEGYFDEEGLGMEINKLVKRIHNSNYDKKADDNKNKKKKQ